MNIAVVGPSPVPYTPGGAEKHIFGIYDSINQYTPHNAELIKLPVREFAFWDLIQSYYDFYKLDLSHFDTVIVTKYPSWMVRHPKKILHMIHTLRGLYDTYFSNEIEVERGVPAVDAVLDYMENNPYPTDAQEFFDLLFKMKEIGIPERYEAFPGPFIRKIIRYLDKIGLNDGVVKYATSSQTLKNRTDYFPEDASVQVIHPATDITGCAQGDYKHLFFVSRLDHPKRIDILIEAMKHVKADIPLYIGGKGPDRERLEKLAKDDPRIHFLGYMSDEDVDRYYADSLVIPYFPYDEDYGYITIEAMLHKKPVITTHDAGGPNEFVADGETGFSVETDPVKIAEVIDYFAEHPEEAKRMGENAYEKVKDITWENAIKQMLEEQEQEGDRPQIALTSTFSVYPPLGGGQSRIYNLYREVAKEYDVLIEAFTGRGKPEKRSRIAEGMIEEKTPVSDAQAEDEMILERDAGIPVTDIAMILYADKTPAYGEKLRRAIEKSGLVVISHPYLYYEAKKYLDGKPFIYEAHNVEYLLKKDMLPSGKLGRALCEQVFEIEKECCDNSAFIITCSEEDREKLHELYGTDKDKVLVVPNGVDASKTPFVSVSQRMRNKDKNGLLSEKIGIFMGSWHGPNLEACERIFELAPLCPGVKFILMGSQCAYFQGRKLPENVGMMGLVTDKVKDKIFGLADFALNPMMSGSGTNLKMFDYMAAGLPVITTEFGTRGIGDKSSFLIADTAEDAAGIIKDFKIEDQAERTEYARKYVEEVFDWSVIAKDYIQKISEVLEKKPKDELSETSAEAEPHKLL